MTPDDGMAEAMAPVLEGSLAWAPREGGMAPAGDLGFTVGTWAWTPPEADQAAAHGAYVSLWRRDEAEAWRVWYDAGDTASPGQPPAEP